MNEDSEPKAAKKPRKSKKRSKDPRGGGVDERGLTGLQRPRAPRACDPCRRKKVKCDGNEPLCGQCAGAPAECKWSVTKDRAATSRRYVQQLEQELQEMRHLFEKVAPVVELLGNAPNGIVNPTQEATAAARDFVANQAALPHAATSSGGAAAGVKVQHDIEEEDLYPEDEPDESTGSSDVEPDTPDLAEKFGSLTIDDHGQYRWIGGASTMSLVRTFRSYARGSSAGPQGPNFNGLFFPSSTMTGIGKVREWALPQAHEVEYPTRALADLLVGKYFEKFHQTMPVLDKVAFLHDYHEHMEGISTSRLRDDSGFLAVLFAVFACAARFVSDPMLSDEGPGGPSEGGLGMTFYERAMILHFIGTTTTQIAHVQSVVLLASFLASLNSLPESWLLLGQAVRTAQDLGLHRSTANNPDLSIVDKEMWKRIFWCVYGLDRMLAIALGRPLGMEDSDCDVELPLSYNDEDLHELVAGRPISRVEPSWMDGFIVLTRLHKIGGEMLRQVYAVDKTTIVLTPVQAAELQGRVDKIDQDLTKWCDELPQRYKINPTGDRQVIMAAILCTSYYAVLISLHRVFLPTARRQSPSPTSPSMQKVVHASRSCIMLARAVREIIPASHHLAFFVQYLFSSGLILLVSSMQREDSLAQQVLAEVETCIGCLHNLEQAYPTAKQCREYLFDLLGVTRENIQKHKHRAAHGPPGAARKERRYSKTSPSSSDSSGKKRHSITPPTAPGVLPSQQNKRASVGQAPVSSGQFTIPGVAAPQGTFAPSVLRPGTYEPPPMSGSPSSTSWMPPSMPTSMPQVDPSGTRLSTSPGSDKSLGHKRTREEREGESDPTQYTFGTHRHTEPPLRPPFTAPIRTNDSVNHNTLNMPLSAPNDFNSPSASSFPYNTIPNTAFYNNSAYQIPPGWTSAQTYDLNAQQPSSSSLFNSSSPTNMNGFNMPSEYTTNNYTYSNGSSTFGTGQQPQFDVSFYDRAILDNFTQDWNDVSMDTSFPLDPSAFKYDPDLLFSLDTTSGSQRQT